eukprot:symbB.v1.2.020263.t1/scaffold1696.1/size105557/5
MLTLRAFFQALLAVLRDKGRWAQECRFGRGLLLFLLVAVLHQVLPSCFTTGRGILGRRPNVARGVGELGTPPPNMPGLEPSQLSLGTAFALFVVAIPGVIGTIQRSAQPKFVEKSYVMPGTAAGGLEMRSIAGGIVAYFTGLDEWVSCTQRDSFGESMGKRSHCRQQLHDGGVAATGPHSLCGPAATETSPSQLQGSVSQAAFLTMCLAGAIFGVALLLVQIFPEGPFGVGPDWWFLPMILSPSAGVYYWQRAFRKDIVELQLGMSDDFMETTLLVLGSLDTIEELQSGVRFQSDTGKLYRLMEKGMEFQPGIFESNEVLVAT